MLISTMAGLCLADAMTACLYYRPTKEFFSQRNRDSEKNRHCVKASACIHARVLDCCPGAGLKG